MLRIILILLFISPASHAFSWKDTEAGYFPQGFKCMTREEKVNFKYFLTHSYSGLPMDSNREFIIANRGVNSKKFYDEKLAEEEWLCPAQALSIKGNYNLEREKNKRGEFRRNDVITSIRFNKRPLTGFIFGNYGAEVTDGLYKDQKWNLDFKDGKVEGVRTGGAKLTVRPLVLTHKHRFIIVTLNDDQHVICYPKSMHKECNPFQPAPPEQLSDEPQYKTVPWPEDTDQ